MKKATVNIIRDLVGLLTFVETIKSCEVLPNDQIKLTVCNTHGLVDNGLIVLGIVEHLVIDVIDSKEIIIAGTGCPIEEELTILAPTYIHGTVKAASSELTTINSSRTRFQVVYLYEVIQETRNRNPLDTLGRTVDIIMFFLSSAKMEGEITTDKYVEYINPMDNLTEDFIDLLEASNIVGSIEEGTYTIIPHSKAGFYDR
jgi:hypothetical protein